MKAAIVGCGNIGTAVAEFIATEKQIKLSALVDENTEAVFFLWKKLKANSVQILSLHTAIKKCDLIIETASGKAAGEILDYVFKHSLKKKIIIISTGGAVSKTNLLNKIKGCEIYFPSGAIAGLDAIKSVRNKIDTLQLTTTKPSQSLLQSPYVIRNKIKLRSAGKRKTIFEGTVYDAVKAFPQNINVAASLFLASRFKKIKVRIIADPAVKLNSHEIICTGNFGTIKTMTENLPSKNPKTSYLAVLSVLATVKNILTPIKTGC